MKIKLQKTFILCMAFFQANIYASEFQDITAESITNASPAYAQQLDPEDESAYLDETEYIPVQYINNDTDFNLNEYNQTPLMEAIINKDYQSIPDALNALPNPRDINHQDELGNTALHYAAKQRNDQIIAQLLDNGASLHIKNYKGETPKAYLHPYQSIYPRIYPVTYNIQRTFQDAING